MDKQVFAAIEINSGEVRLVVAESYNGRFNIIKTEHVNCQGKFINIYESEHLVVDTIKKAVKNASKCIGVDIKRVLLCVPCEDFERFPLRVKANLDTPKRLSSTDIMNTLNKATKAFSDPDKILVNAMISKYYCDGMSTRKIPLNEHVDELLMDVDLFCGNREVCYQYVKIIETAGLELLDIFFDQFALCKEANVFEKTLTNKLLLIKLERDTTTLSLVSKGCLLSSKIIYQGLSSWFDELSDVYDIDRSTSSRLVKYNVSLDKGLHKKSPVYIWSKNGHNHTLSEEEIYQTILPSMKNTVEMIQDVCSGFDEKEHFSVIIGGEGAELQGFHHYLNKILGKHVENYIPETLGVRDGSMAAAMGCLYAYKDVAKIKGSLQCSLDLVKYHQEVAMKVVDEEVDEDQHTITSKFKNIFEKERRS